MIFLIVILMAMVGYNIWQVSGIEIDQKAMYRSVTYWMTHTPEKPKRGRPKGSKNKPK